MQKIIVSLTSYPKRITIVHKVIESLFEQTWKADQIILYLSKEEFPQKEQNLPQLLTSLLGQNGFSVVWVDGNLRSHKKYFYSLRESENIVITIDDDTIYAKTMIEDLVTGYKKYPQAVLARNVRTILLSKDSLAKYRDWDRQPNQIANQPRRDLCAIGVGGILYPPKCASKHWFDKEDIQILAVDQDDLWLKFHEIADGIPVVYVPPTEQDIYIDYPLKDMLSSTNVIVGKNDDAILKLEKWMETEYEGCYRSWLHELSDIETYIAQKKEYYGEVNRRLLETNEKFPIYLYGAGKRAGQILRFFEEVKLKDKLEAVLVSDKKCNPRQLEGVEVRDIREIDPICFFGVIYGVAGEKNQQEIDAALQNYKCKRIELDFQGIQKFYTD